MPRDDIPESVETSKVRAKAKIDDRVEETYRRLKYFKNHPDRKAWKDRRDRNWKGAIENEILTPEDITEAKDQGIKSPENVNKCNKGVQGACAIATSNSPEVKYLPVGSGDLYLTEVLNRGFKYVWHKSEGNQEAYDFVEENKVSGLSFLEGTFEESTFKILKNRLGKPTGLVLGRIKIEETTPEDIYFDPDSRRRDFSDTDIIKAKLRSKPYLKEHYGDELKEEHLVNYIEDFREGGKSSGVTSGDNYAEAEKTGQDTDDGKKHTKDTANIWEIEAWMLKTVKETYRFVRGSNGEYSAEKIDNPKEYKFSKDADGLDICTDKDGNEFKCLIVTKDVRELRIIVGTQLIGEPEINPDGEDYDGNPIMRLIGLKHQRTRGAYPMCPTDYALPINRNKAKAQLQLLLNLAHNVNSPIVESKGTVWKGGNPGTPGSKATVPTGQIPVQAVTRLQPGSFEANHFFALENQYDMDIDDQYDLPEVVRGKIPKGQENMSGRLGLALQDTVAVLSKPFMGKHESALVRLGRTVMALMLRHWPREMWESLIDPDEWTNWKPEDEAESDQDDEDLTPEEKQAITAKWERALDIISGQKNQEKITISDIDVRISAGSSMPTNRIARSMEALERVKMGVYDTRAYLEYIDDPNSEAIAKRVEKQRKAELEAGLMKKAGS